MNEDEQLILIVIIRTMENQTSTVNKRASNTHKLKMFLAFYFLINLWQYNFNLLMHIKFVLVVWVISVVFAAIAVISRELLF